MTLDSFVSVDGHRATSLEYVASAAGAWTAKVDLEGDPVFEGGQRVAVRVGELVLVGQVDARASGRFGLQTKLRVVGGLGWSGAASPKHYHDDRGVKRLTVLEDLAREVGETLGDVLPPTERLPGRDYVRQAGPASQALQDVLRDVAWWVGEDGRTHVGTRPVTLANPSTYTALHYNPRDRSAELAIYDARAVRVGSILEVEGAPLTVRDLKLRVSAEGMRLTVSCSDAQEGAGLASLLRSIVQHTTSERLWGSYRYRVVRMAGERVELQAVRRVVGLPDLLPISTWPGLAGAYAQPAPGAEVLVQFVEGDRAQPIVTHFAGPDSPGFVPTMLTLGGTSGAPVARQGDVVEIQLVPTSFSGLFTPDGGAPMPVVGAITQWMAPTAFGVVTGGSTKVRVSS